MSLNGRIDGI